MRFEHQAEAAQQQCHVSALGAVIGVKLIEHQVLQRGSRFAPYFAVFCAQQQLVQHLVVGQQNIWRVEAYCIRIIDQRLLCNHTDVAFCLPGVNPGRDPSKGWLAGDEARQTISLVVRERVHGVEQQRFDPGAALSAGARGMVQHRV